MRPMSAFEVVEVLVLLRERVAVESTPLWRFMGVVLEHVAHSRSQFLQDMWVAYETDLADGGFFVEFGAADGLKFSNSAFFEQRLGWRGIVAEPGRNWQEALKANRTCHIDTRCVWSESGRTLTFSESEVPLESGVNSGNPRIAATYEVETVSLMDLLRHWNAPRRIDYLSLDTEGSELEILQAFDFDAYDVRLITVEHNHKPAREAIHALLTAKGYVRRFTEVSAVDDWYVRQT